MDTTQNIKRYRDGLITEQKYDPKRQRVLKSRVYETFDALLCYRGLPGLKTGMQLTDLGSADGSFVDVCRANGVNARGLDISDQVNFEHDRLPVPDVSQDVVTANSVIEHLYNPNNFLEESLQILKPGGAMILVCPNWRYSMKTYFDDPTHVHPYTEVSLKRLLRNFRFYDPFVVPWLVKKPTWMWDLSFSFFFARCMIPFRGTAPGWVPSMLKGKSASIMALAVKPGDEETQS